MGRTEMPVPKEGCGKSGSTTTGAHLVASVKISEVFRLLGGGPIRHGRAKAFWRNGDGWNVDLVDARGVWHDKATNDGGGVLGLIRHINGGTRAEALHWLADATGAILDDRKPDPAVRAARLAVERELPVARAWRRAWLDLADELLEGLKSALFDPTQPAPAEGEIAAIEGLRKVIHDAEGAALVNEYIQCRDGSPGMTMAMVSAADRLIRVERRTLERFIKLREVA